MKTSKFILSTLTVASLTLAGMASADEITKEGYLTDTRGNVVKSAYGLCWHTGFWTPAMAIMECDPDLVKKAEPKMAEAPRAAAPAPAPMAAPAPAPAPMVVVGPEKAAFEKITLQAETLFDFDKSEVRPDGKNILDNDVIAKMKQYPQVEVVLLSGHADRIGSEQYNRNLSERRAAAIKEYLVAGGVESNRIETAAKGESEPVVSCDDVKGKVSGKNKKLVGCLQPNRRVVVEVKVQRPVQR